ncbi:MAG: hypothetical protein QNK29_10980 [Desulfobacterales bacterium]|nr:hypothetical protein [Desulfobacterales bacterium]MDX2512479.1 hypothetical protein [Desulfobacterales bacterium]
MFVNIFCGLVLSVFVLLLPLTGMAEETEGKENQTQQWAISVGLFTRHVNPSSDTNESTKMLGLAYSDWGVLSFSNSYGKSSIFGGKRFHTKKIGHPRNKFFFIQGNLYAGIIHGYGDRFPSIAGFIPAVMPTVGFGYRNTTLELLYFPTPSGGVFTSVLVFRF